jgi:hypothetical protein
MKMKINFSARVGEESGQFLSWLGDQKPPFNRSTVIRRAVEKESRQTHWKKRGWAYQRRMDAKYGRRDPYEEEI